MPVFENVERKISFLKKVSPRQLLNEFSTWVKDFESALNEEMGLSQATIDSLVLNLSYGFFRNARWYRVPLFREAIASMLVEDFRFPRLQAESLVDFLVGKMTTYFGEATFADLRKEEMDFFRYIFVHVMSASEGDDIVSELGLGGGLLQRVKAAAQIIDVLMEREDSHEKKVHFIPEIDSALAHVMIELADEQESCPWTMDVYRLKYILEASSDGWREYSRRFGFNNVFALLVELGMQQMRSESQLQALFRDALPDDTRHFHFRGFLDFLSQKGLIFRLASTSSSKTTRWTLADKAYELTQKAFTLKNSDHLRVKTRLASLHPYYQAALINHAFTQGPEAYVPVVEAIDFRISPRGLAAVFSGLQKLDNQELFRQVTAKYTSPSASAWQRRTACCALAKGAEDFQVRLTLQQMAESDESALVRSAALEELLRVQPKAI